MQDEYEDIQTERGTAEAASLDGEVESSVLEDISALLTQTANPDATEETEAEDTDTREQAVEQTEETPEAAEEPVAVIDDALIAQFPVLKPLKGKPITELAKSYEHAQKWGTKLSMENAELKKSQQTVQQTETETNEDGEYADLVSLSPEEQIKRIREIARAEILREQEPLRKEYLEAKQAEFQETMRSQIASAVEPIVGKDQRDAYAMDDMLAGWKTANAAILYDAEGNLRPEVNQFYANNPNKLLEEVTAYAKTKAMEDQLQAMRKGVKLDAYKKTVETIAASQKSAKRMKSQAEERDTPQLSDTDRILQGVAEVIDSRNYD